MAFWNRDGAEAQAQEVREETGATAMNRDPDVRNAMRGIYTGKYAQIAASLPAAWDAKTRNVQVARSIAQDKGFNDSGVAWNGNEWKAANTGTPLAVQLAPYVIGGVAGYGAAGGFSGGTGATSALGAGGANSAAGYGPLAGAYGGATTGVSAAPSALAAGGGGSAFSVGQILGGGGKSGMGLNYTDLILGGTGQVLNLYGQNKALNANQSALDQQLASTKYATDAQTKSAAESLAFLRQQAGYDASVAEANRSGDYQQWAAKQEQLGSVGQALGLPSRRIPAYVPLPAYTSGAPTGVATTGAPGASSAGGYVNAQGQPINLDRAAMTSTINESFQRQFGRQPTATELDQVLGYASKPDLYSDQQWRIGPNDYLVQRVGHQSASADPRLAGTAGIIAAPTGYTGAAAAPERRYQTMQQPLGAVGDYFADASAGIGKLQAPTVRPRSYYGGAVGSYL